MATVTTVTQTVTVNAAFLREIKEVNLDLWRLLGRLRGMCDDPTAIVAAQATFAELIDDLRDQLALHFALEEAYGYFENPIEVAPQLCERADSLRSEHAELYLLVVELADQAFDLQRSDLGMRYIENVIDEFRHFDQRFAHHESLENELILQQYDDDLGVGD